MAVWPDERHSRMPCTDGRVCTQECGGDTRQPLVGYHGVAHQGVLALCMSSRAAVQEQPNRNLEAAIQYAAGHQLAPRPCIGRNRTAAARTAAANPNQLALARPSRMGTDKTCPLGTIGAWQIYYPVNLLCYKSKILQIYCTCSSDLLGQTPRCRFRPGEEGTGKVNIPPAPGLPAAL